MGYRHYFLRASKKDVEEIQHLSYQELVDFCKKNDRGYEAEDYGDGLEVCLNIHKILPQVEVFEFGKYYENAEEIHKNSEKLFKNEETMEYFEDYEPHISGEKAVECAIEWQINKIRENFAHLLLTDEEIKKKKDDGTFCDDGLFCDDRPHEIRLLTAIQRKAREWDKRLLPFSLDREKPMISSWLYEYTVFELVKLHREMDWENDCLLFYGW